MAAVTEPRWDVPSAARLAELVVTPLPLGLTPGPLRRTFHRDLYFDTPAGDLPVGTDGKESYSLKGDASHYTPVATTKAAA